MDSSVMHAFHGLPLDFEVVGADSITLSPIPLPFSVPPLADKPQDPIIDAINRETVVQRPYTERQLLHKSISKTTQPLDAPPTHRQANDPDLLWKEAAKCNTGAMSQIMSWDALCRGSRAEKQGTPFLSEQEKHTLAAARHHVLPHLQDPAVHVLNVTSMQLFDCLKMTVLGTNSLLYAWDQESETFRQVPGKDGRQLRILVDRKDEVVSSSVIQRFMLIGTIIRRLEKLVSSLRTRFVQEGPVIHAFTHTLSNLLVYLSEELAQGPPLDDMQSKALASIWIYYEAYEEILVALSNLCGRPQEKSPSDYIALDTSPAWLLSRIYEHLSCHIEKCSSRLIIASFAYILETSSRDYLKHVCHSVGIDGSISSPPSRNVRKSGLSPISAPEGYFPENWVDDMDDRVESENQYPNFFPLNLADLLPTAKKSLKILRAAQADHPIFTNSSLTRYVEWVWTEDNIERLLSNDQVIRDMDNYFQPFPETHAEQMYEPKLSRFRKFDLEPGAHLVESGQLDRLTTSSTSHFRKFLATFPDSLPAVTPTLSHLTSLMFTPLIEHTAQLSRDLLSIFLSHSSTMHFQTHLVLLRSYLLLTSNSFTSRLTAALFSDAGEDELDNSTNTTGDSRPPLSLSQSGSRPWAVGLAPSLTNRDTWPPGGTDLSFLLRTVIVDSLELDRDGLAGQTSSKSVHQKERHAIFEEAEFRLGFAIRDLPTGPGRDRWLNPLSIEALDFLYLDFKPPGPLGVLVTPEILSKYHRIFAFLLRMMRVENVVCALTRMTRYGSKPLFPTLKSSHKLILYFQFIARAFVTSLTGYVFDTVIRGNFDAFLAQLSPDTHSFSDIFALAKAHSAVLDDILFACLLRSGQRAVGDLLRGALAIILDFGVLAGELKRGRLEEHQAAVLLEDYFKDFREKMTTLTRVLKALADKESMPTGVLDSDFASKTSGFTTEPPRGTEVLHHLLVRLDFGDWWSRVQT